MARAPLLARFDIFVFKDKSPTDPGQVPADARVDFYRQGATVKGGPYAIEYEDPNDPDPPPPTELVVFDRGALVVSDDIQWLALAPGLRVMGIDSLDRTKVSVSNFSSPTGIVINPMDRLVPVGSRPYFRLSPTADANETGLLNYAITDPSTGRVEGYLTEFRFDYVISDRATSNPFASRWYFDAVGSFVMR